MNPRVRNFLGIALLSLLALFVWARTLTSWRPQLVGFADEKVGAVEAAAGNLKVSPDGQLLYLKGSHSDAVWNLTTKKCLYKLPFLWSPLLFSPDSKSALVFDKADYPFHCTVLDMSNGQPKRSIDFKFLQAQSGLGQDVGFAPDGHSLLFLAERGLWRSQGLNGSFQRQLTLGADPNYGAVRRAALAPNGTSFLLSYADGLRLYDTQDGHLIKSMKAKFAAGHAIGFSPDSKLCWDWNPGSNLYTIFRVLDGQRVGRWTADKTQTIHFVPEHEQVAMPAGNDLKVYDIAKNQVVYTLTGPLNEPFDLMPDASYSVSCDDTGKIWRWRFR